jgi:UDP-N-acetylmuramyl pentapeptide phosphotransferase/UDP-N-acetylglucosamine-1-phosphate transferase
MISAINLIILLFLNIIISFTSLIYLKKIFLDKKEISNKILNRFGERWGNSKKSHFGGIAISVNIIFTNIYLFISFNKFYILNLNEIFFFSLIVLLSGIFGYLDEKFNFKPLYKLGLQVIVSIFLILNQKLINFSSIEVFNVIFTIIVFVYFFNVMNMFDNIDMGLTSVSLGAVFFMFALSNSGFVATFFLIITFSFLLTFIYFNKFPSKMFMGDIGSFQISVLFLGLISELYWKNFNFIGYVNSIYYLLLSFMIFTIPIYDFVLVISRRIYLKKKIFIGDTNHFSHVLNLKVNNPNYVAIILFIVTSITGFLSILVDKYLIGDPKTSLIQLITILLIQFIIMTLAYIKFLNNE